MYATRLPASSELYRVAAMVMPPLSMAVGLRRDDAGSLLPEINHKNWLFCIHFTVKVSLIELRCIGIGYFQVKLLFFEMQMKI